MSTEQFHVVYDGESVRSGITDVRDLAPALLAVGELCQEANRILNGDRAHVSIRVRSDFQRGSFDVALEMSQTLLSKAQALLHGDGVKAAKDLLEILGLVGGIGFGLLKFIKWLKNREITSSTTLENGNIQITIQNSPGSNNHLEISPNVGRLYEDESVRTAVQNIVKPLERPGIDRFEVRQDNRIVESITKDDLPAFISTLETKSQEDTILRENRTTGRA